MPAEIANLCAETAFLTNTIWVLFWFPRTLIFYINYSKFREKNQGRTKNISLSRDAAFLKFSPSLGRCRIDCLLDRCRSARGERNSRFAQSFHPMRSRHFKNFLGGGALGYEVRDLGVNDEQFKNRNPFAVSLEIAFFAARPFEKICTLGRFQTSEFQKFLGRSIGLTAIIAVFPQKPFGYCEGQGAGQERPRDSQLQKPGDRPHRIAGGDIGKHKAAGKRRAHRDLRGFVVP